MSNSNLSIDAFIPDPSTDLVIPALDLPTSSQESPESGNNMRQTVETDSLHAPSALPSDSSCNQTIAYTAAEMTDDLSSSSTAPYHSQNLVQANHQAVAATEFHGFLKLPPELRLNVYKYMMHGPRYIIVEWTSTREYHTTSTAVPAILHVNRESRKYAEEKYSLLSFPNASSTISSPLAPFGTHIDYTQDFILLMHNAVKQSEWEEGYNEPHFLQQIGADARSHLRHLALAARFFTEWPTISMPEIPELTSLETLCMAWFQATDGAREADDDHSEGDEEETIEDSNLTSHALSSPIDPKARFFTPMSMGANIKGDLKHIMRENGMTESMLRSLEVTAVSVDDAETYSRRDNCPLELVFGQP